jgi:hypothetical protein
MGNDEKIDPLKIMETFVEVELKEKDDFLRIAETLTRVGVSSHEGDKLYQSAHILHKRGKYYIVSFKEMFLLDGKRNTFTDEDRLRRNKIALLLQDWGLLTVKNPDVIGDMSTFNSKIDVIPYKEKSKYTLVAKYTIGKAKGKK